VANAIEFIDVSTKYPSFCDSQGTIKFIRTIDQLFDMLNSSNPIGKGFKTPPRLQSKDTWQEIFSTTAKYLLSLKTNTPITQLLSTTARKLVSFADDTNIFISHKDPTCLTDIANTELDKINSWFKANKLSLNIKKTNFMIFKTLKKVNSKQLERLTQISFLGVVFYQHLSWKPHISKLATKIAKSAGVIFKCRFYLPKKCLLSLYYALVYPYLHYCNLVWGSS
jgi:hypothetical protein